jgi:hypothetical protein
VAFRGTVARPSSSSNTSLQESTDPFEVKKSIYSLLSSSDSRNVTMPQRPGGGVPS